MTTLGQGFDRDLRAALVEDIEAKTIDEPDNLTHRVLQAMHADLRAYGRRFDYDVESVIDSLQEPDVTRRVDGVTVRLEWDHVFAHFSETGTRAHHIEGRPILSFVWERRHDPPPWVRENFELEGDGWRVFFPHVDVAGIPKGRWIRDTLEHLDRLL